MKSLISRESYRREERYSGVYHTQGSMITDADLDERSRITQERTDNLGDDSIKDGVPRAGGAVGIANGDQLFLREGVIYADGVRGVLTAKSGANLTAPLALFSHQADFPESPGLLNNSDQIVYADIWERPVYPLEDEYLADAGLHGAVTSFRTRTMTQLKSAPLAALEQIEAGTGAFPQIGTATVAVTPLNAEILADDCDPCAEVVSADQAVPNALWRLEVIDVQGTPDAPEKITLAWSIENASAIAPADVNHEDFERTGKVYEFYSEITESHLGVFADSTKAKRSAFVDDLETSPSPPADHNGQPWPFVRRWDGQAVIDIAAASLTKLGSGFEISITGQVVKLKVAAFELTLDLNGAAVVAGDYWLVELRRFAPEAEQRIRLVKATPVGVLHHYCTLFRVGAGGDILAPTDAEIRKLSFPTLSNLPATHVGFENGCQKLYADAENVQEALDNLCDISADDIAFKVNCPELYDDAENVQEALDALCNIDFSVRSSFRLLFDWGVLCGIVPSLKKAGSGHIAITSGGLMDRSGKIGRFRGADLDLSTLRLGREIHFGSATALNRALAKEEACLALAIGDGGEVTVHVVPTSIAFGPDDPGFQESFRKCIEQRQIIELSKLILRMPKAHQKVAHRVVEVSSGGGVFNRSAKLTPAEFEIANTFNEKLFVEYKKLASDDEIKIYKARRTKAKQDNPLGSTQGAARMVRQMQQASAIFEAFTISDEERMRRCLCRTIFPTCPPELGDAPFLVPIACLRGSYEGEKFFLREVCPFCCRKQAMTWRSLQYFVGDMRDKLAKTFSGICCDEEKVVTPKPPKVYDPSRYLDYREIDFLNEFRRFEKDIGRPPGPVVDDRVKISVNDLSENEAKKTLRGYGFNISEVIDVDDEKAFEIIESKSVGVMPTDRLAAGGMLRPGDKVGLLVQDGVARNYVLLERGTGKLPFPTEKAPRRAIIEEDELRAKALIDATNTAKSDLRDLTTLREGLSGEVKDLTASIETLRTERAEISAAVEEATGRLAELANTRTAIVEEVKVLGQELEAAEASRKTVLRAVRESQPVTAVIGNRDPQLVARLAGEGITSVKDIAKLSDTRIRELRDADILKINEAKRFRIRAGRFVANPSG